MNNNYVDDYEDDYNDDYNDEDGVIYPEIKYKSPDVEFENLNEKIINEIITRDYIENSQKKYKIDDTIWNITNYGRFVKYSDLKTEYNDYYHQWYIYPMEKYNNGKLNKLEYILPNLFIKLINAFIKKDNEEIQKCCKIFYKDYDSLKHILPDTDIIKENYTLTKINETNEQKIKRLEEEIILLKNNTLYNKNILLEVENDKLKLENDKLKQENDKLKQENDKLKEENDIISNKFKLFKNAVTIFKDIFNN